MQATLLIVEDEERLRSSLQEYFLMISGIKRETVDRVVGLEVGADVYMTKPFETRELLAQVRALLRRIKAESGRGRVAGWLIVDDDLRIHLDRRLVEAAGQEVHLTRLEFDLLKYLAQRPGVPCARADLIDAIWRVAGWMRHGAGGSIRPPSRPRCNACRP